MDQAIEILRECRTCKKKKTLSRFPVVGLKDARGQRYRRRVCSICFNKEQKLRRDNNMIIVRVKLTSDEFDILEDDALSSGESIEDYIKKLVL